jgi:hypothetical protein
MSDFVPTRCADDNCWVTARVPCEKADEPWWCAFHQTDDGQQHD